MAEPCLAFLFFVSLLLGSSVFLFGYVSVLMCVNMVDLCLLCLCVKVFFLVVVLNIRYVHVLMDNLLHLFILYLSP